MGHGPKPQPPTAERELAVGVLHSGGDKPPRTQSDFPRRRSAHAQCESVALEEEARREAPVRAGAEGKGSLESRTGTICSALGTELSSAEGSVSLSVDTLYFILNV